jgi:hypothetical protein
MSTIPSTPSPVWWTRVKLHCHQGLFTLGFMLMIASLLLGDVLLLGSGGLCMAAAWLLASFITPSELKAASYSKDDPGPPSNPTGFA